MSSESSPARSSASTFEPDAVIGETRQTVEEACRDLNYLLSIPDIDELAEVGDDIDAIAAAFCREEHIAGDEPPDDVDVTDVVELGDRLLQHPLTRAVLTAVGDQARSWPDALAEINTRAADLGAGIAHPARRRRTGTRPVPLAALARPARTRRPEATAVLRRGAAVGPRGLPTPPRRLDNTIIPLARLGRTRGRRWRWR